MESGGPRCYAQQWNHSDASSSGAATPTPVQECQHHKAQRVPFLKTQPLGFLPTEFLLPNRQKASPELWSDAAILHTLENDLTPSALFPQPFLRSANTQGSAVMGLSVYFCHILAHFLK